MKKIIFQKLKLNKACDIYELTVEHLRHAGEDSMSLLCIFINRIIDNLRYLSAPEFKIAIASIIFKGKNKPKNSHKSYRLVRVSPLLGRIIDEHIRPLAVAITKPLQSINQYGFQRRSPISWGHFSAMKYKNTALIIRKHFLVAH